eukprot:gene13746-biopygen10844
MGVTRRDEMMTEAGHVVRERTLGTLAKLPVISAACSGQALCGDFGGTGQLRFMEIGGMSSLIAAMERLATRWGVSALVDDAVQQDASTGWDCRLHEQVVYAKRGGDSPLLLWQVAGERDEGDAADGAAGEWIYSLAAQPPNPWEEYNDAMRWWIAGRSGDARRRAAEAAADAAGGVRDALAALRDRIRDGPMLITIVEEVVATARGARSRPTDIAAILHSFISVGLCLPIPDPCLVRALRFVVALQMRYAQVSDRLPFPGPRAAGLPRRSALWGASAVIGVPRW